jgi:hypothetical protein
MVAYRRFSCAVNSLGDSDMKFYFASDIGSWYRNELSFNDDFKDALHECLKRGINCWPDHEKAGAIRNLIEEMEGAK